MSALVTSGKADSNSVAIPVLSEPFIATNFYRPSGVKCSLFIIILYANFKRL